MSPCGAGRPTLASLQSITRQVRPSRPSRSSAPPSRRLLDQASGADAVRRTQQHGQGNPVCTENLIRIDCVTESPNVNGDDRALLPLPDPVRLAVQVEEPTWGRERGAPSSTDCASAQGAGSRPAHKWGSLVLGPAVSIVCIGAHRHHYPPPTRPQ